MTETPARYDAEIACASCGRAACDRHHIKPRGRSPSTRDDLENIAPVCRPCHEQMIPTGTWSLRREDHIWVCFDTESNEVLSRRPIEVPDNKALVLLDGMKALVDERDERRKLVILVRGMSDDGLYAVHELGRTMAKNGAYVEAVAHREAYARWPYKNTGTCDCHRLPNWTHHIADTFEVSPNTVYQNVKAMEMFLDDATGAQPLPLSFYKELMYAEEPMAALAEVGRPLFEEHGTVADLRVQLGKGPAALMPGESRECPVDGRPCKRGEEKQPA